MTAWLLSKHTCTIKPPWIRVDLVFVAHRLMLNILMLMCPHRNSTCDSHVKFQKDM